MVKGKSGSSGQSVFYQESNDIVDIDSFYEELKAKDMIIEELIRQTGEISEFHPESINTIRVASLNISGTVQIIAAVFRIGNNGKRVDNFHYGGIAASIDIKTGIVVTAAVDQYNHAFLTHPITNKQIIGFRIPQWDEILDVVKNASHILPDTRYIGWDIVLTNDNRICFIEGNGRTAADLIQMPDQIGKWSLFKNLVKTLSNK